MKNINLQKLATQKSCILLNTAVVFYGINLLGFW